MGVEEGDGEFTGDDLEIIREVIGELPQAARKAAGEFLDEALESMGEEEFLRVVFVGDCPACGSRKTVCCDEMEGIDDPTVGLCEDCKLMWCLECGMKLDNDGQCGHWDVCEECPEERDEYEDCGIEPWECPRILDWRSGIMAAEYGSRCCWCRTEVPEGAEVFAVGAKIKDAIDFVMTGSREAASFLPVTIGSRTLPAIITTEDSQAKLEGNDLMFMTCSEECATELKAALEEEKDLIEKASLN